MVFWRAKIDPKIDPNNVKPCRDMQLSIPKRWCKLSKSFTSTTFCLSTYSEWFKSLAWPWRVTYFSMGFPTVCLRGLWLMPNEVSMWLDSKTQPGKISILAILYSISLLMLDLVLLAKLFLSPVCPRPLHMAWWANYGSIGAALVVRRVPWLD